MVRLVIWDAIVVILTSMSCNARQNNKVVDVPVFVDISVTCGRLKFHQSVYLGVN